MHCEDKRMMRAFYRHRVPNATLFDKPQAVATHYVSEFCSPGFSSYSFSYSSSNLPPQAVRTKSIHAIVSNIQGIGFGNGFIANAVAHSGDIVSAGERSGE